MVAARHDGCAEATRVRLPRTVPARAVRRVRCVQCARDFEAGQVHELPTREPLLERIDPSSISWRLLSLPLAAAAVIGGLLILQGGDDEPQPVAPPPAVPAQASPPPAGGKDKSDKGGVAKASKHTTLVQGSTYRLALPAGWEQVNPPSGATFKAVAPDGGADATLWIERDPGLGFDEFASRSARQLEALAGAKPEEVERVIAPNLEDSVVRLAADPPPGQPSYEVTLRASGDYRYYLATSVEPDASGAEADGADLISESLKPEGTG